MKKMKIKLEEQDDMTTDSGKEYLHLIIEEQRNSIILKNTDRAQTSFCIDNGVTYEEGERIM